MDLELSLLRLASFADQRETCRPVLRLLQSLFPGQSQSLHQRRGEFSQGLEKTIQVVLEDLVVLPQTGRFGDDLEQKRSQIVDDDASLRTDGLKVFADDERRTLTGQEGRGHACADGGQEPNHKLESLRIEVLENREMSNQGTECGLQLVGGDVRQLLLKLGAPYGAVRIPEQFDDSLGGRVLQRSGDPAGPAVTDDVETQSLVEVQALLEAGMPEHTVQCIRRSRIKAVTNIILEQAWKVAPQQVMAVERADTCGEVAGGDHCEDPVAWAARAGIAKLDKAGRQQFLEHTGSKTVGLDTGPFLVRAWCPLRYLDVFQVGQARPRGKCVPLGVPPGHVLETECLLVESALLPLPG